MGEQRVKKVSQEEALAEAEKALKELKSKQEQVKAEKVQKTKLGSKKITVKKKIPKTRSQKYKKAISLIDKNKFYDLDQAIALVKKTSYAKFDAAVEIHLRMINKGKPAKIQGLVDLPYRLDKETKSDKNKYKTDRQGIIHQVVGRISWGDDKIKENIQALLAVLPISQLASVTLCASMGPGIKIKL